MSSNHSSQRFSSALPSLRLASLPFLRFGGGTVIAASLGTNILALAVPLATLQVYDRIIPNASADTLVVFALALFGAFALDAMLRFARAHIANWAGARMEHTLACAAVDRLLQAPIGAVEAASPGTQLERLAAIDPIRQFYADQGPTILIDLPFAVLFLGLIAVIGGTIVAVPVLLLALFGACAWGIGRLLRRALADRNTIEDRRLSFMIETLVGIHTVKSLAAEPLMARRHERLLDSNAVHAYWVNFLSGVSQALGRLFAQLSVLGVVMPGAFLVVESHMTLGALAACTLLCGRALQPLMSAMGLWAHFQTVRIARERLSSVLELEQERAPDLAPMPTIAGAISLDNVTFGFPRAEPLFENAELQVRVGETIAISGPNGCGKSSLLWLMSGILEPSQGAVRIDGVDIRTRDIQSLRRQIAYLPQYGVLFRGTILENLTLFRDGPVVDDALEVVAALGLDEVVARLPRGLDTMVGDSAVASLAGGVRQRLAIARALVGHQPILMFDEANTMLDARSDEQLRQVLAGYRGRKTMILVSYRPSILRLADRAFLIADRRLVPDRTAARPQAKPQGENRVAARPGLVA
jgi:ATP-binding cassette, subfamily C, bacterial LapB